MNDFITKNDPSIEDVREYVHYVTRLHGHSVPFHFKSWSDDGEGNVYKKASLVIFHCV